MPTASPENDGASGSSGVSMSRLLASCAAAYAVSTPPPPPMEPEAGPVADDARVPMLQDARRTPPDTPEPRRREAA